MMRKYGRLNFASDLLYVLSAVHFFRHLIEVLLILSNKIVGVSASVRVRAFVNRSNDR